MCVCKYVIFADKNFLKDQEGRRKEKERRRIEERERESEKRTLNVIAKKIIRDIFREKGSKLNVNIRKSFFLIFPFYLNPSFPVLA